MGEDGGAVFLGAAGIDGGLVDDQVARLEDLADGGGGLEQGREVGTLVLIHRGGDGDDEEAAGAQSLRVTGYGQVPGGGQFLGRGLAGAVAAGLELEPPKPSWGAKGLNEYPVEI